MHGIEGMFDKVDDPQPGTQRYGGASHTRTVCWDFLAQTLEMEECMWLSHRS